MSSAAPDGRAIPTRGAWLPTTKSHRDGHSNRNVSSMSLLFVLAIAGLLVGLAVAMQTTNYDIWGGLLVGSVLLLLTVPLATRAARQENDPKVGRIILLAALVKLSVGSYARYVVAYYVYKASDAEGYFGSGAQLAPQFRIGDFSHLGPLAGTRFIEVVCGVVIAIINETRLGAFVVFSWLGFLGLYCFYQAFRLAFPEGDHRRYRLLVFFWPSLLFWPSSIGKDAWMVFMLGMAALGIANLYVGRWRGGFWVAFGSLGCIMVRPHLTAIMMVAFALGLLLRRNRGMYNRMLARPIGTVVLVVGMVLAGALVFQQTQTFFKLDSIDLESTQTLLNDTAEQTAEGGSAFTPPNPNSPLGYIEATVTVLFRPFPTEVTGTAAIAGLEGVALAGLVVMSWRRIVRTVRMSLRNAYVAFAVGYTLVFVYAFAALSNFGILARERSQVFPLLFVILAIPKRAKGTDDLEELDDATEGAFAVAASS
ncbi:MAG: hypothetical protein QOH79_3388 [Acidimicrobiaceae bacterium]